MPYVVSIVREQNYQPVSLEEFLAGPVASERFYRQTSSTPQPDTRTYYAKAIQPEFVRQFDITGMITALKTFCEQAKPLYQAERSTLYHSFYIPKKSGGFRQINAPTPPLMEALRQLKILLEETCFASHHTCAFAFVRQRCTVDALRRHQSNQSRWFLKTDFADFFGSTTFDFTIRMLKEIFPFSEILQREDGQKAISKALSLCFYKGGLPQGTPISPLLTNLVMIPVDYRLSQALRKQTKSFVYTRYADDLLISSRWHFSPREILQLITSTLAEFQAPYTIKPEKTRYGSSAGANWNLGLMLNKDNQITIGHRNKKRFRAMIHNYVLDRQNGTPWDLHDVQILNGHLNYYQKIERQYVQQVIQFYNEKYHTDVMKIIKIDLGQTPS